MRERGKWKFILNPIRKTHQIYNEEKALAKITKMTNLKCMTYFKLVSIIGTAGPIL